MSHQTKGRDSRSTVNITIGVSVGILLTISLVILYVVPNLIGGDFLSMYIAPAVSCSEMSGVLLVIDNSYFMPVVMSYDGPDLSVDVFGRDGALVHHASFLSEELHDEEEGLHHVARIPPGMHKFVLKFDESLQFFTSGGKLPRLHIDAVNPNGADDSYALTGKAFGILVDSKNQEALLLDSPNGGNSQCITGQ